MVPLQSPKLGHTLVRSTTGIPGYKTSFARGIKEEILDLHVNFSVVKKLNSFFLLNSKSSATVFMENYK